MLSRVRVVNETVDLTNCIIGSMDVKALYPSIDIDFAVEKCVEMILKSNVKFENETVDLNNCIIGSMDVKLTLTSRLKSAWR